MSTPTQNNSLSQRVKATPSGENLLLCYSCGTCVSKCMIQKKINPNYNPRRLIREAVFDDTELALPMTPLGSVLHATSATRLVRRRFTSPV